ncbi:type II toxin-antitoxin system Phd/YefM family antitoxin [Ruminococcaceae bacterium OttesenSCG-928-A11]|nr:type II toxin-antitoxin system Phd/YefM family antitoxin [Ruminococcaceae bacterium OttesenSCG-928-A11]
MMVDTELLVPMTDANQNFSKVVRMVDEHGSAVILKNNKPRYVVVDFEEYDEIRAARELRRKRVAEAADTLIAENMDALKELAK